MKKALSLILALVLCAALAVPAFATQIYYPGVNYDPNAPYPVDTNGAAMGPSTWLGSDGSTVFIPAVPVAPVTPPDDYYEVQVGDTLEAIAFAFYGRASLASALRQYNANGHFLQSGGILEATRALRIPATLDGVARLANPLPVLPAWSGPVQLADGTILYRVQSGDTLKKIAATFYDGRSDAFLVNAIVAANADVTSANTIYAGQIICLPLVNIGI